MTRLVGAAARAGLAATLFLFTLAVLRWGPVHAESPWDVRALPLAGAALVCATLAALTGRERRPGPVRPLCLALVGTGLLLAGCIALRGSGGLAGEARDANGAVVRLPPGPIDVLGRDLDFLPAAQQRELQWNGLLRAPRPGHYRLWLDGRGAVELRLDGRLLLRTAGERVRAGVDVALVGEHALALRLERRGPGLRLRLGWTRPDGASEGVNPRQLGPATAPWLWRATDLLALVVASLVGALVLALPWDAPRRPPAGQPFTAGEWAVSALAHALLVVAMAGPLFHDPARLGVVDRPDGRLNAWILAWGAHALTHEPGRLFQAPVFHPLPDALAFSENLVLPAALTAPASLLGGPVLAYNLALLLSLVGSGLGAQLLVRRVSGDRLAAFLAGAIFAVGAHRWVNMAHLHAHVTLFLPFALLALDRFWERRSLGRGLLVGGCLALQALSSIYLGAIGACALAVGVVLALLGGLRRAEALRLATGLALVALLVWPVARPYFRMRAFQGMEFGLPQLARFATTLESYAAGPAPFYADLAQRHLDPQRVKDPLFPGVVPLVLGLVGLARAPRRYRAFAVAASLVAVTLSLGPHTPVYRFLHEHVVLFRGIRALSRFSVIPVLCLSVLSGLALAGRFRLTVAALGLFLAEAWSAPGYGRYEPPSDAARWLSGRPGAVAYLPLGRDDTQAMLESIVHFRPLVNGDSAFIPRPYDRERELLEGGPSADALRFLRAIGVRDVVTRDERPLPLLARFGDERIYAVPPGDAARGPRPAPPAATHWTREAIVLDLGAARRVGRVVFELGDAPWLERPRVEVSLDGASWSHVVAEASLADATLALTRDPRAAQGEVRFGETLARFVRLDAHLPARPGALAAGP
jgi:hypothetical protein